MINLREEHNIELPRAKGAYLDEAPAEIWSHPDWVIEVKMDGTRESLQIGKERSLFVGRNRHDKLKGVEKAGPFMVHEHPVFSYIANEEFADTILDGECTLHFNQDGDYDENTKVRKKQGIFCGYTVWGCLWYKGQDVRHMSDHDRRRLAARVVEAINSPYIRLIERFPAQIGKLKEIWYAGEEGAIAKLSTGTLRTDQRTCSTWYKLKTEQTVDAFITNMTEGKTGGSGVKGIKAVPSKSVASFTMSMMKEDGGMIEVCKLKHFPDEIAKDAFNNYYNYRHRVIEMRVSGWNGKSFRWSRFIRWREDKRPKDCIFSEQVGGK